MPRLFPNLRFGGNRTLETKTVTFEAPRSTGGWGSIHGRNRADGWDMEQVIAEGYERSVWTYRCVELMSGSQSRLPFRLARYRDTEREEVIDNHPLYRVLNVRANPLETARAFRKRLSAQVLLSKKGAFVEVTKSRAGIITRLDLLDPDRVQIVPSDSGDYIDYFEYVRPDGQMREIPPERIRWVREPHPTDPFCGTTPLEAAGISIELDQLSRLYNVNFIKNDARPGGVLSVDTTSLTTQEMARLESRFQPGAAAAGHLSVIASGAGGVNYVDTTTRPRDMAYAEAAQNAKNEILAAFGIGESVLANSSGRTFDNADQEEYNFWTKPMPPHNDLIATAFAEDVDEDLTPFLDTSKVEALEAGERRRRQEAREEFSAGLRSVDEYRPLAGLDALNQPQSRAVWIAPNKSPIPGSPEDAQALLGGQAMPGADGGAVPPGGGDTPDGGPDGDGGQEPPAATATVDALTAADIVEEARAYQSDTDLSLPTGDAAHLVDEARTMQDSPTQDGDAAATLAQARATTGAFAPTPEVRGDAGRLVDSIRAVETKALAVDTPAVEYEPSEALSNANALALNATLAALLARQEPVITARLESPKARKGTPFWRPESPTDTRGGDAPMDIVKAVDVDRWADEAATTLSPVVQDAVVESATQYLTALAATGVLDGMTSEQVHAAAARITRNVSLGVLTLIVDAIVDHLERLIGLLTARQLTAETIADLTDVVHDHYRDVDWPRKVAGDVGHTIALAATEHTAAALREDGDQAVVVRQWVSRQDGRVRPTHTQVDGTVLPVGERFLVGDELMLFPQDPAAAPHERYGCRCKCRYFTAPKAQFTLAA